MRVDLYQQMYHQEEYYWWHVGRRKLVLDLLRQYLKKKPNLRLVDMGCGTGMMISQLKSFGEAWGVDFSKEALRFCQKRGHKFLKRADLSSKIPLESNFFDVVLSLDTLEHIENEENALAEFSRILKKNGLLILIVPAYKCLWSYWDEMVQHKRRYHKNDLVLKLKKAGFSIKKISYYNASILPVAVIFRLLKGFFHKENKQAASDFIPLPAYLNRLFLLLGKIERFLVLKTNLPFGLSLVCLAKKG